MPTKTAKKPNSKKDNSKKTPSKTPKRGRGRPPKKEPLVPESAMTEAEQKKRAELFRTWDALEKEREKLERDLEKSQGDINATLSKIETRYGNGPYSIGGVEHFISSKGGKYFLRKRNTSPVPEVL